MFVTKDKISCSEERCEDLHNIGGSMDRFSCAGHFFLSAFFFLLHPVLFLLLSCPTPEYMQKNQRKISSLSSSSSPHPGEISRSSSEWPLDRGIVSPLPSGLARGGPSQWVGNKHGTQRLLQLTTH
ncbi:hypothetical protein JZ751_025023 [Albula glossodonta]|uniref:Uncharacterized protein n=1 Tax=Albula glossodonta TaxID=121402 RepID=A0A8T2PCP6_9TELE|nr:hypothetical protein JZ751_025023 [Albula glossodonta]